MARKRTVSRRDDRWVGSKWSAAEPTDRDKHFEVVRVIRSRRDEAREPRVELRALLSRRVRIAPLSELDDRTRWRRGWHAGPPCGSESEGST